MDDPLVTFLGSFSSENEKQCFSFFQNDCKIDWESFGEINRWSNDTIENLRKNIE